MIAKYVEIFWSKVNKTKTCWLWTGGKFNSGYGVMHVNSNARSAHRVSYELAFGPIPKGMAICHKCDIKHCVKPGHLFAGTQKENVWDMKRKGRANNVSGSKIGTSKLTEKQVHQIFSLYPKMNQYKLAIKFGVTQSAISRLLSGENWKYAKRDASC